MADKRKATVFAALAIALLVGGCVAGSVFPRVEVLTVGGGFAGYLLCGRQAMIFWRADEKVFVPHRIWKVRSGTPSAVEAGLMLGAIGSLALAQRALSGHGLRRVSDDAHPKKTATPRGIRLVERKGRGESGEDD